MNDDDTPSIHSVRHLIDADARAEAAEAKLREAVEVIRKINSAIFNDNGDVTWNPLAIREAARSFLATMEKLP